MSDPNTTTLSGLAKKIVQEHVLSANTASLAVEAAAKQRMPLVSYLVENKIVDQTTLATIASTQFGDPLLDLDAIDYEVIPKNLVSEKMIRKHHAIPIFRRGNRIYIAISDPTNTDALNEFKFHTGVAIEAVLVEDKKLTLLIDQVLSGKDDSPSFASLEDTDLDALELSNIDDTEKDEITRSEADDAPIVRFVNKVLLDAINRGASDIHFEPYEKQYRVRFRRDGILTEFAAPPVNLAPRLAARLKIMARLDISERRIPQDGRFKMKLSRNRTIDFRMSTCPTLFGEKVVMRILDPSSAKMGIDALGYEENQKTEFLKSISRPQGMILVTGPTGSGKTISLYTALNILNTIDINISTAEDPVEINLPGINQVNVNVKTGLTFSSALRSFLRQDPDVIMVGEIRDLETAEIAVKAAQTGHLVLSTLHTNGAAETLTRLMNMGIPAYNIASSVSLIIAQRLARRLCEHCKEKITIPDSSLTDNGFTEQEIQEGLTLFSHKECSQCNKGYRGRVGIYEVLPITPTMGRIIMEGGNALSISDQMRKEGINTLRRSGLNKVKMGITALEEINRVTQD